MLPLPVLDLLHGRIVRGIAGRREAYRPIRSKLTDATDPLSVARAFREHLGLTTIYLADLDAIAGEPPSFSVYQSLRDDGFRLWLDCGLRDPITALALERIGIDTIIAGLETLPEPDCLRQWNEILTLGRLVVSLDMKDGKPLTGIEAWRNRSPEEIAGEIIAGGCRRLLLLDLARVGMNGGPATEELARRLRGRHGADVSLAVGGGIRDRRDLLRLKRMGVDAALIASAFHDGRITREDLRLAGDDG